MKQFPFFPFKVAPEVDANGVSAAYLAANEDTLPADVPMFPPGTEPGDGLFCMIDGVDVPSMTRALTDDDKIGNQILVRYPGSALRALTEGNHSITYRCEKPEGTVVGTAVDKTILVLLVPPLDLVPPIVSDAPGGRLNPISALSGTAVHVRYGGMLAGQRVQVHWHGVSDAGSIDTAWQTVPATVPDFLPFGIEPYLVAANVNATVDVGYTVDRDGDMADSSRLSLVVTAFNLQDMPMPQLPDLAGGDRIEPDKWPNGLRVDVPRWHLAFEGQQLWLWCDGTSAQQPGAYQHHMRTAHRVTATEAAQGIFTTVPGAWLAPLAHGSRLYIDYQVGFHEGGRQSARRLSFEVLNPSEEVVGDGVR
ncbi:hypothetical protein [Pandoraea norimbergensis]|uniref:Uncharacterized protein n=1 Tax=Pandoraea norimbergensis TaxID=93219 RepID=A0ABM5WPL7_9BURK|nr:hypothetical protein [Pandoraea norimbergensis]ALS62494.1 hypothetical protein AT302_24570 [Pandoraea norimbergensis]